MAVSKAFRGCSEPLSAVFLIPLAEKPWCAKNGGRELMGRKRAGVDFWIAYLMLGIVMCGVCRGQSPLILGPERIVQADGADIAVPGYSVPSYADWNNDGRKDLIVGQGGGGYAQGKVRIYLNEGTASHPQFSSYFFAQSDGCDVNVPAGEYLGAFPRFTCWDYEPRKDLVVGRADGTVKVFLNIGTESEPVFDEGTIVQVGYPGSQQNLDVGMQATPTVAEWNGDYLEDMVAGDLDGKIHIYINCGCKPDSIGFYYDDPPGSLAQEDGNDLIVPSLSASPELLDLDADGIKDLLTGNAEGQLLFYKGYEPWWSPVFSGYSPVESAGVAIDLPGTPMSRPFVCDWTGDGYPDVLIGANDGKIHLYQSIVPSDINGDSNVDFVDFALFAAYWGQLGCGTCGGADLTDDGNVDFNDLEEFVAHWPKAWIENTMEPADLDGNGSVDFVDFASFAPYWKQTDCGNCGGADLTGEGDVDFDDLKVFAENWLAGC